MYHIDHQKYGKFTHNLITATQKRPFYEVFRSYSSHILLHAFSILYRVYLRKRKEHVHAIAK